MKTKHTLLLGGIVAIAVIIALALRKEPSVALPGSKTDIKATNTTPAPPIAQPHLSVTESKTPTPSSKKFSEMGVFEEEAIVDEIKKQDLPAIFKAMLDAMRVENDSLKQMHLKTTFANALTVKKPTPEFIEQLYEFVTNKANTKFERGLLIGALEGAATKESLGLLIRLSKTAPDEETRDSATAFTISATRLQGNRGRELSPLMERTWCETDNLTQMRSTASAMAKIGKPSGIELLLTAALATDERNEERKAVAQSALEEVNDGDAVPPLAARLKDQPPTSEAFKLLAPILAGTSAPEGQQALVSWLQERPENVGPLVHDFIRNPQLYDPLESAWAKALDPAVPFKNEENRKAIRENLDAYRASHPSE